MEAADREQLRAEILEKYATVYAFALDSGISKSICYQVLAGSYHGAEDRQALRMREALGHVSSVEAPAHDELVGVLSSVACERCKVRDRRKCRGCQLLWARQAEQLQAFFSFWLTKI